MRSSAAVRAPALEVAAGEDQAVSRIEDWGMDRERRLFEALREARSDVVTASSILGRLRASGVRDDDPRIAESVRRIWERASEGMDYDAFATAVRPGLLMLERIITRNLVLPDFQGFSQEIGRLFEQTIENRRGEVADYIPQLGRVDPELYSVSLTTVDGQRLSLGDALTPFCTQSSTKPVHYCLALEEHGEDFVHSRIGCEPSGQSFNELTLDADGRPHNPMINAGAIMSTSMIRPSEPMADRFEYVLNMWSKLAGGMRPGFDNSTYLSERRTADRNFALGYFMREKGGFPEGTDLVETLEFYFQCCSLEVTAELMSVVAATLANGGVCPITGVRVFRPDTVQKCLALMYSCGMYDFSGEWAFRIGLPAKSGVSGVIMVVVPNVMGICTWSPRLDGHGNSVRGIDFFRELVSTFNFHNYDNLIGAISGKKDPRQRESVVQRDLIVDLCWAASEGDVEGIRRLVVQGANLNAADYDGRTPLHLAASEGQPNVISYLVSQGVDPAPIDRWGNTPLEDARRAGHHESISILEGTEGIHERAV
jgi:glutaminase